MAKRIKFRLLTDEGDNGKLAKSAGTEYRNCRLSLAPADVSGYEMCSSRTTGCTDACVGKTAGRVVIWKSVMQARIRRTRLFVENRDKFIFDLYKDLEKVSAIATAEGRKVACRLNTFSDQPWEVILPQLFTDFADIQFYDYTKIRGRMLRFVFGSFPPNYYLTYSLNENTPAGFANTILTNGGTVTAAIDISIRSSAALPEYFSVDGAGPNWPAVDGDSNDLRFLDPRGSVVLLRAKGNLLSKPNDFVRSADGSW